MARVGAMPVRFFCASARRRSDVAVVFVSVDEGPAAMLPGAETFLRFIADDFIAK
jgi:hypothetical protein